MRITAVLFAALLAAALPAAAPPKRLDSKRAEKAIREVAGSAEYLRGVPKKFALLKGVDAAKHRVTLLLDGDKESTEWPLLPDAEVKVDGWWGRADQLALGQRVWVWMMTDRKKKPVAVAMLADEISHQDIRGDGDAIVKNDFAASKTIVVKPSGSPERKLTVKTGEALLGEKTGSPADFAAKSKAYLRTKDGEVVTMLDRAAFESRRDKQRQTLKTRWQKEGLPGGITFVHVFSGEMDLMLDHEAMRWARSLEVGDRVTLPADPAIPAVVKKVSAWRERTLVRLVAKSQDLADLKVGQRLSLKMSAPRKEVEENKFPPDMDRKRDRAERIDWFLASIYCTCGVRGDTCTGHFYTLASCNPNGCGKPNEMRKRVGELIDKGLDDKAIFEKLLKDEGVGLLQPHLLP